MEYVEDTTKQQASLLRNEENLQPGLKERNDPLLEELGINAVELSKPMNLWSTRIQ